jgi:hypothetical protein
MSPASLPSPLVRDIVTGLRIRYASLNNIHYEAAWTDSWCHIQCFHDHKTLLDASECAMPHGAGWYVFAVENGSPRELTSEEDKIVEAFRFGRSN